MGADRGIERGGRERGEREREREREKSKSKTSTLKDSSIRSGLAYLTVSPCYSTNIRYKERIQNNITSYQHTCAG